jgi:hypothetical protein
MKEIASFEIEYGNFHRYARLFGLRNSLIDIWKYSLHITEGLPLPEGYLIGEPHMNGPISDHIYSWDLDVLARELVLHARICNFNSLRNWGDLATIVNQLRKLDEAATSSVEDPQRDVMMELHRIGHRQFPWQGNKSLPSFVRTLKIYGDPAVDAIVSRELGMTTRQFLLLGMTLGGQFFRSPENSVMVNYEILGITLPAQMAFFNRIITTAPKLKATLAARPFESQDWLYGWNPLERQPLLVVNPWRLDLALCPIPRYLLRRMSSGLYYDLVGKEGFDNPFGRSFEKYVGDVIAATCQGEQFVVRGEETYKVGLNKKHGVDWVISDHTAHMFIETKTKRMSLGARTRLDMEVIQEDLSIVAKSLVQLYKNIRDAMEGLTSWKKDDLPVYPVLITLEDLYIFSPKVDEMLRSEVRCQLAASGLSTDTLTDMTYTIMSVGEFETISQVIAQVGIAHFMAAKTAPNSQAWSVFPYETVGFKGELKHAGLLFQDEMRQLFPQSVEELTPPN